MLLEVRINLIGKNKILSMKKNTLLKNIYEQAYENGKSYSGNNGFFTFPTCDITSFLLDKVNFKDKRVLEIGCGTGETAYAVASKGEASSVLAIDYSSEAITTCNNKYTYDNLHFMLSGYQDVVDVFDIIIMQEVIEHLDNPEQVINKLMAENINKTGVLVLTCPNFINIRGYVWMTLQTLFGVPMSLTDINFLSPFDFVDIANKNNYQLEWTTFAHDRVLGDKFMVDMRKRLTNALKDASLPNDKVDELLAWLNKVLEYDNIPTKYNGAKGFYYFGKQVNYG